MNNGGQLKDGVHVIGTTATVVGTALRAGGNLAFFGRPNGATARCVVQCHVIDEFCPHEAQVIFDGGLCSLEVRCINATDARLLLAAVAARTVCGATVTTTTTDDGGACLVVTFCDENEPRTSSCASSDGSDSSDGCNQKSVGMRRAPASR